MRIRYKIYWFEDDIGRFNRQKTISGIKAIENYLKSKGFYPEIIFYVGKKKIPNRYSNIKNLDIVLLEDYTDKYLKTIDFSNVDLVLMDYNLGTDEENGDKIISFIRENKNEIFTDILFYSQNKTETELRKIADRDGLYCSNWDEIFSGDKIKKVIKTTIRKTQELNNLRGLVMAETSELDGMVKEILKLLVEKDKVKEEKIVEIKKEIIIFYEAYMNGNPERKIKGIEQYNLPSDFFELLDSRHLTAYNLMKTLKSFSTCEKNSLIKKDVSSYSGVQQERNNLAHIPEDSSNLALMKIKGIEYDEKRFIKIRIKIQKYKELFQKIIDDLNT